MKRIVALIFCLGLALAQIGHAEDSDKEKHGKKQAKKEAVKEKRSASHSAKQSAQAVQRNARIQQKLATQRSQQSVRRSYPSVQRHNEGDNANVNAQVRAGQFKPHQPAFTPQQNQNDRVVREHRRGSWNRDSFAEAKRHHSRHHHHRDWWRQHYTRFTLFGGGYYYWNRGYWYPAYGYDPGYNTYIYDEPIYGYNELSPAQVIVNVQAQLRRQGYYYGAIDGLLGPMTRSALARYQAAHGLIITRAIDEPTLASLGLV